MGLTITREETDVQLLVLFAINAMAEDISMQYASPRYQPAQQDHVDFSFLDKVKDNNQTSWKVTLHIGKMPVEFKIGTGAAIKESTCEALNRPTLTNPTKTLCGPSKESMEALRVTRSHLKFREKVAEAELYVFK